MKLINTIRVERAKKDISQRTLAEAVGLSVQAISNIENGTNPMLITAYKIACYFNMKVQELFTLKKEGKNEKN